MTQIYTAAEVSRHNHEQDLWIVIHDSVYDLTKFLKEHPGGEEVLLNLAGQDGTKCFDDIGHSQEAIQLRETYKIGEVSGNITPQQSTSGTGQPTVDDDDWEYQEVKEETSPWLPVMIGIGAVIYGLIFYYIWY